MKLQPTEILNRSIGILPENKYTGNLTRYIDSFLNTDEGISKAYTCIQIVGQTTLKLRTILGPLGYLEINPDNLTIVGYTCEPTGILSACLKVPFETLCKSLESLIGIKLEFNEEVNEDVFLSIATDESKIFHINDIVEYNGIKYEISTVDTGTNFAIMTNKLLRWETMIAKYGTEKEYIYQNRYGTKEDAISGHNYILNNFESILIEK